MWNYVGMYLHSWVENLKVFHDSPFSFHITFLDPLLTPWTLWAFQMRKTYLKIKSLCKQMRESMQGLLCLLSHFSESNFFLELIIYLWISQFHFLNSWILINFVNVPLFIIHLFNNEYIGYFYSLAIMNESSNEMAEQVFL